jgi:chaperonin GroES
MSFQRIKNDGSVKSPISALRCISSPLSRGQALRRTVSTPHSSRFASLDIGLFTKPSEFGIFTRELKIIEHERRQERMKVRPLHDRILVKRLEEEATTKGGIIIPDTAKEKPYQGEVIAVGSGRRTEDGKVIPLDVKAGNKILLSKYAGTDIKIDDVEYLIMREEDVLGIIEK